MKARLADSTEGPDGNLWRVDRRRGTQQEAIRWMEAAPPIHPVVCMGISDRSEWVLSSAEGAVLLRDRIDHPGWLPLLELPLSEFQRRLQTAFPGTNADLSFPAEQLAIYGLQAWGKHWPLLALNWADALPLTEPMIEVLRTVVQDGSTQQIRQLAQRLLRRSR